MKARRSSSPANQRARPRTFEEELAFWTDLWRKYYELHPEKLKKKRKKAA